MKIHSFLSLFTQDVQNLLRHSEMSQQTLWEHLAPHLEAAVPPKQMASPLGPDKQPSRDPAPTVMIQQVAPPTPSSPGVMVGVVHGNVTRATQVAMNQ